MKKFMTALAVAFLLAVVVLGFRGMAGKKRVSTFYAMGGIPVRVAAYDRSGGQFDDDMRAVQADVDRLEDIYSRYRAGSDIARLNAGGRGCAEWAPAELTRLLERARYWHDRSSGAFDVTVTPLIALWKQAGRNGILPTDSMLADARARVGMRHVRTSEAGNICFDRAGMSVDLGAIAKGAILDDAATRLRARGVARGLVDAGGDVAAFGKGTFTIGIQDPRDRERLLGSMEIEAGGVVTSGDYERFVTIGGKRYSHIIDPRSGMPTDSIASVTVVGPSATDADALATAISVLGREEGIELVRQLPAFGAIIIEHAPADNSPVVWISQGLERRIRFAEDWHHDIHTF